MSNIFFFGKIFRDGGYSGRFELRDLRGTCQNMPFPPSWLNDPARLKDIEKARRYPDSSKDSMGRLLVGAAIGVSEDREGRVERLLRAGVDILFVDTAHGHSLRVEETARDIKKST